MNAAAKTELSNIAWELGSIIRELESISGGVRSDFAGIGNDLCADAVDRVINQYYTVKSKLENCDTTAVTESFARAHQSSGGGGGSAW